MAAYAYDSILAGNTTWGGVTPGSAIFLPGGGSIPEARAYLTAQEAHSIISQNEIYYDEWILAADPNADPDETDEIPSQKREAALLKASHIIDSITWKGSRFFPRQGLAFPRIPEGYQFPVGTYSQAGPDEEFANYVALDQYLLQQKQHVLRACAFQANALLKSGGEEPYREDQLHGLAGQARGYRMSESWQFREPSFRLCPAAWDELLQYKGSKRIVRGGSRPSIWDYGY